VWHDIDDFLEMTQRLRRSEQKPPMPNSVRLHASTSRASSEPLHDHISAAGQCTVRARSEATMSYPARPRSHPLDHLPTDRSAGDAHEVVRHVLNFDIIDGEERQRQDDEQEDGKQPQQEVKGDVAAALTGKVGDAYLSSKEDESLRPAERQRLLPSRDPSLEPSHNKTGGDSGSDDDGCSSTGKHSRWSDLDEHRLLAYKKEDKSWDWIFGKFPGRTPAAVRTRWNMIRPRVE
jgi:hypothetical protein